MPSTHREFAGRAVKFTSVSVALLVAASALGAAPTPAAADQTGAVAATELSPDEFLSLFDNAELPGLGEIGPAPAITGNAELDARIRAIGEQRGYQRRALPNRELTRVGGHLLQPEAAEAWQALRVSAQNAGFTVTLVSAFRSEAQQAALYRRKVTGTSDAAIDRGLRVVAVPGYSKHHTGYAIDLADSGGDHNAFGNSRVYAWLAADNFAIAKAHGFVPSYPFGSSAPIGPNPEPWEFVWVGTTNIICGDFEPSAENRFCDTVGSAFQADVNWLAAQGITTGCGSNRFCIHGNLTRAQAATLLWRYSGKPETQSEFPFVDVPTGSYYSQAAQWMFARSLTTGVSATHFDPDRLISRAEFITFLWRMANRPEPRSRIPPFSDVSPASFFAKAVAWAAESGIDAAVTGGSVGSPQPSTLPRFEPAAAATRGEAAAFIHGFANRQSSPTTPTTPTAPTTPTTPSPSADPPSPLVLGFGGDLQILDYQAPWGMLVAITDILSGPDLMFANLETVVGTPSEVGPAPINKAFNFLSPPEAIDQIVASGIDVLGMANNHTWDFGPRGAASTRRLVDDSMLIGTGAGATPEQAYAPVYVEVADRVIGVVSLTTLPCEWANSPTAERIGVAWACDRFAIQTLAAIHTAATNSDIAVVMLHSGWELTDCPTARQREIIDFWIDIGADIISITHPHQLQGVEVIDGAAVLWSTGNLAFQNGGFRRARSAVFEITISDQIEQIRLIPTVLPGGVAAPADADIAKLVFSEVSERTVGGRIDENGILVPDPDPSICDY
ncbi:MAG: hypothetical protein F4Z58_07965 [Acidimicrobiaceae bacterium]|nr:hypothetical protein [Acidimicrobiaceae bacterium]MYD06104.1 hypothetical protein [Acidimicrobiaceae bacterium]MYI57263.1 hypothetical protein [Acidimicrobiaceae bacterium]